jgi:prepilin signal peptidase PulO-like enzyme (type II secretory pathway)
MVPTSAAEWLASRALSLPWAEAAVTLIAFAAGATVGSFLNVVAHRVPRGESVVRGGSRCPSCGTRIRPRDNVPVLGWLLLGGRCRDCGRSISVAYPSVEAGCGLLVATLAAVHLAGGVWPDAARAATPVFDRCLMRGDVTPLAHWLHDAALLLVLVAWALLAARGHRPAAGARGFVVAAAAVAALTIAPPPGVRWDGAAWPAAGGRLATAIAVLVGCTAGLAVDRLAAWTTVPGGAMLIGAGCGWQAVAMQVALVGMIGTFRRLSDPRSPLEERGIPMDRPAIREGIATWLAAAAFVILTRDILRPG